MFSMRIFNITIKIKMPLFSLTSTLFTLAFESEMKDGPTLYQNIIHSKTYHNIRKIK